jgi:ubiquinone/menaquinone biosynthesis C-methylase UbiE
MRPQYVISPERSLHLYTKRAPHYKFCHSLQTLGADELHRRLVVEALEINHHNTNGHKALDIGTGTALTAIKVARKGVMVTGVDICPAMLRQGWKEIDTAGARNIELKYANAEELPFENNTFQYITSFYGLGGIADAKKAIDEAVRVGKNKATIVVAEMVCPEPWKPIRRFLHKYFVEPFVKKTWEFRDIDLVKLLQEAGVAIKWNHLRHDRLFGSTMIVKGVIEKKEPAPVQP